MIEADVLKVDFAALARRRAAQPLRVVGNLPYNISTPILFHLLRRCGARRATSTSCCRRKWSTAWSPRPAASDYGRLSVMLQWRYDIERVLDVPPEAFDPPPRVDSARGAHGAAARSRRRSTRALLGELVQVAFSQRRKLLRHTLGRWLEQRGFARRVRPAAARRGSAGGRVRRAGASDRSGNEKGAPTGRPWTSPSGVRCAAQAAFSHMRGVERAAHQRHVHAEARIVAAFFDAALAAGLSRDLLLGHFRRPLP